MIALALAIAPVLALIWYITHLDRLNKEPLRMLLRTFVFGLLSILPAIFLESAGLKWLGPIDSIYKVAFEAFIVVGFSEELAKYLFLRFYVYKNPNFDEPYDGIVYAVMISLGFAALENVFYVLEGGLGTAVARMFTAVPAHATFGVLMGYWMGKAKMENKPYLNWLGLATASFFHGAYDFFLLQELFNGQVVGALLSLLVAALLARRAIKIHTAQKAILFHEERPDQIDS